MLLPLESLDAVCTNNQQTALHFGARGGNLASVEQLIQMPHLLALLDAPDFLGRSALHWAGANLVPAVHTHENYY